MMLDYHRVDKSAVEACRSADRFGPISERLIQGFYENVLKPGDVTVDVGVHYGIHLFPMSKCVGEAGTVFGIEANVERYAAILKELARKGIKNVQLMHIAATNAEGFMDFFVNRTESGYSGLVEKRRAESDKIEKVVVFGATLASIVPAGILPRFIKIDIEGAEFPALLGAKELIRKSRALIIFEGNLIAGATKFGLQTGAPGEFMRGIGYDVFDLFGNPINTASWGGFGWNFLAVPNDDATLAIAAEALTAAWAKALA